MKSVLLTILSLMAGIAAYAETLIHDGIVYTVIDAAIAPAKVAVDTGEKYVAAIATDTEGVVTIPETFSEDGLEYRVTAISGYAFYNCRQITEIVIPQSVVSIGTYAFYGSGIRKIALPLGLASVDKRAFQMCTSLESIENLEILTRIRNGAFRDCSALKEIVIGSGFASLNDDSLQFSRCYSLESVVFKDGASAISGGMFEDAGKLVRVVIPSSVNYIGDGAFRDSPVKELTIPQCVVDMGITNAFPSAAETIEEITLVGVTTLTQEAFDGLTNLKRLYIPGSVKEIPDGFFDNMSRLENLVLPNDIAGLNASSFANCDALWSKWYGQLTSPAYDFADTPGDRKIASMTISGDAALDEFVLRDGKVYDSAIMVENTSDAAATLSLPAGYRYVTAAGKKPLSIPPSSLNLLTITRTSPGTFLVSRQKLVEIGQ